MATQSKISPFLCFNFQLIARSAPHATIIMQLLVLAVFLHHWQTSGSDSVQR